MAKNLYTKASKSNQLGFTITRAKLEKLDAFFNLNE
jgi:hypothetical protein